MASRITPTGGNFGESMGMTSGDETEDSEDVDRLNGRLFVRPRGAFFAAVVVGGEIWTAVVEVLEPLEARPPLPRPRVAGVVEVEAEERVLARDSVAAAAPSAAS